MYSKNWQMLMARPWLRYEYDLDVYMYSIFQFLSRISDLTLLFFC